MGDYIKREDAINALAISQDFSGINAEKLNNLLSNIPSADVVERKTSAPTTNLPKCGSAGHREPLRVVVEQERKRGEWQVTDAYPHNVYCSVCHMRFAQTHWAVWEDGTLPRNFCPNCGAIMTEGVEENATTTDDVGDCNICRYAGCSECDDCVNGSEWVREVKGVDYDYDEQERLYDELVDMRGNNK